jgi:hypothetical protein
MTVMYASTKDIAEFNIREPLLLNFSFLLTDVMLLKVLVI